MAATLTPAIPHPVILVVEDMDSLRHTIQETLEAADFLVLPASNAFEALELSEFYAGTIDLLITKLHPDGMPAPDLAFSLRNVRR